MILFGSDGRILRIERCTGSSVELSTSAESRLASGVTENYAWLLSETEDGSREFSRVDKRGGELERVEVPAPPSWGFVTDSESIYYTLLSVEADESRTDVFRLEEREGTPDLVASLVRPTGVLERLRGVSSAGLYFSMEYDCGCTPAIRLLADGNDEPATIPGAESTIGWGGWSLSIAFSELYVMRSFDTVAGEIRRLPLTGGEPEVVVPELIQDSLPLEGKVRRESLRSSTGGVCWVERLVLPSEVPSTLRCLSLRGPQPRERELHRFDATFLSVALAGDAVYWLSPSGSGEEYELFAAAL